MDTEQFRIVFDGAVADGRAIDDVIANVAALYKVNAGAAAPP